MKLSNNVIRSCYIIILFYLCYMTYNHLDIIKINFNTLLKEHFEMTDLSNLTGEHHLDSDYKSVSYSDALKQSLGTEVETKEAIVPTGFAKTNVNFNFINSNVKVQNESDVVDNTQNKTTKPMEYLESDFTFDNCHPRSLIDHSIYTCQI